MTEHNQVAAAGATEELADDERAARFFWLFAAILFALLCVPLGINYRAVGATCARFLEHPAGVVFLGTTVLLLLVRGWRGRRGGFTMQAIHAFVALACLNWLIATAVPFSIQGIQSSYLIFFYHFPFAMGCALFFTLLMVFGVLYLCTEDLLWDRLGRVAGELGVVCCTALLTTGSTWAKAAWGKWWVFEDPRLMSAAVMWLTYAGYLALQWQLEDPVKRRRYCAVFGIIAFLNLPIVHYAIKWFGQSSHPMQFEDMKSDPMITVTRWFGVAAFLLLMTLIYRWRLRQETVRDRLQLCLTRVRRLEEEVHV